MLHVHVPEDFLQAYSLTGSPYMYIVGIRSIHVCVEGLEMRAHNILGAVLYQS